MISRTFPSDKIDVKSTQTLKTNKNVAVKNTLVAFTRKHVCVCVRLYVCVWEGVGVRVCVGVRVYVG